MIKMHIISQCDEECPFYRETTREAWCHSYKLDAPRDLLPHIGGMPDWCPLDDAVDGTAKAADPIETLSALIEEAGLTVRFRSDLLPDELRGST